MIALSVTLSDIIIPVFKYKFYMTFLSCLVNELQLLWAGPVVD